MRLMDVVYGRNLSESKRLEREIDMEIARVEGIVGKPECEDTSLFNNESL